MPLAGETAGPAPPPSTASGPAQAPETAPEVTQEPDANPVEGQPDDAACKGGSAFAIYRKAHYDRVLGDLAAEVGSGAFFSKALAGEVSARLLRLWKTLPEEARGGYVDRAAAAHPELAGGGKRTAASLLKLKAKALHSSEQGELMRSQVRAEAAAGGLRHLLARDASTRLGAQWKALPADHPDRLWALRQAGGRGGRQRVLAPQRGPDGRLERGRCLSCNLPVFTDEGRVRGREGYLHTSCEDETRRAPAGWCAACPDQVWADEDQAPTPAGAPRHMRCARRQEAERRADHHRAAQFLSVRKQVSGEHGHTKVAQLLRSPVAGFGPHLAPAAEALWAQGEFTVYAAWGLSPDTFAEEVFGAVVLRVGALPSGKKYTEVVLVALARMGELTAAANCSKRAQPEAMGRAACSALLAAARDFSDQNDAGGRVAAVCPVGRAPAWAPAFALRIEALPADLAPWGNEFPDEELYWNTNGGSSLALLKPDGEGEAIARAGGEGDSGWHSQATAEDSDESDSGSEEEHGDAAGSEHPPAEGSRPGAPHSNKVRMAGGGPQAKKSQLKKSQAKKSQGKVRPTAAEPAQRCATANDPEPESPAADDAAAGGSAPEGSQAPPAAPSQLAASPSPPPPAPPAPPAPAQAGGAPQVGGADFVSLVAQHVARQLLQQGGAKAFAAAAAAPAGRRGVPARRGPARKPPQPKPRAAPAAGPAPPPKRRAGPFADVGVQLECALGPSGDGPSSQSRPAAEPTAAALQSDVSQTQPPGGSADVSQTQPPGGSAEGSQGGHTQAPVRPSPVADGGRLPASAGTIFSSTPSYAAAVAAASAAVSGSVSSSAPLPVPKETDQDSGGGERPKGAAVKGGRDAAARRRALLPFLCYGAAHRERFAAAVQLEVDSGRYAGRANHIAEVQSRLAAEWKGLPADDPERARCTALGERQAALEGLGGALKRPASDPPSGKRAKSAEAAGQCAAPACPAAPAQPAPPGSTSTQQDSPAGGKRQSQDQSQGTAAQGERAPLSTPEQAAVPEEDPAAPQDGALQALSSGPLLPAQLDAVRRVLEGAPSCSTPESSLTLLAGVVAVRGAAKHIGLSWADGQTQQELRALSDAAVGALRQHYNPFWIPLGIDGAGGSEWREMMQLRFSGEGGGGECDCELQDIAMGLSDCLAAPEHRDWVWAQVEAAGPSGEGASEDDSQEDDAEQGSEGGEPAAECALLD